MDAKFVEIAESELRETSSRKTQALQQFNEMLNKHPFIKKIPNLQVGKNLKVKFLSA